MSIVYTDKHIKYIKQLKEEDLTWQEITRQFNEEFDCDISENAIRKTHKRHIEIDVDGEISDDTVLVKNLKTSYSARKLKNKIQKENKALLEHSTTLDEFLAELNSIESKYPVRMHKPVKLQKKKPIKRTVVAHVSDTHIGSIIRSTTMDGINGFNPDIAARRMAFYVKNITQYKIHHRHETELLLVFNGDLIAGVIHGTDTQNILPASLQHAIAMRIFIQAISFLSQSFSKMRVVCEVGNHSRFMHKMNKGRQTEEKWDSFENILYMSLAERFSENENIEFINTKSPYSLVDIQGHKALITHGDTVINVGNPGNSINVSNITKQINSIAAGLNTKIDLVIVGHVHKATYVSLDNGTHLVINGALCGTDEYAQSLGIISNNPIQQIFEVTGDDVVGDMRFVRVNEGDNDTSLDSIITLDKELSQYGN